MTNMASDESSFFGNRRAVWLYAQIAIVISFAVALMFGFANVRRGPSLLSGFSFSLLVFLCSAIGMWGGLGNWRWRWVPFAIISPLMGFLGALAFGDSGPEFHVFCLSVVAVVTLTSLSLRYWKGQLQFMNNTDVRIDGLQFGIKHIFAWTTAVAVLLGLCQLLYPALAEIDSINGSALFELTRIAGLGAMIAFGVVVNVWAMLGLKITPVKSITLLGVIFGAACVNVLLLPEDYFFFWITIASQLMMTLSLVGLRLNKLRFVK